MVYKGNKPRITYNPTRESLVPREPAKPVPVAELNAYNRGQLIAVLMWHNSKRITTHDSKDEARHIQIAASLNHELRDTF